MTKVLRKAFKTCFEVTLPNDTIPLTFSFRRMTLWKTTIDNSVRYVNKDDHLHSKQTPPVSKEREIASSNKLSQNIEKSLRK